MNKIFKNTYDNSLRFHTGLALPIKEIKLSRRSFGLSLEVESQETKPLGTMSASGSRKICSEFLPKADFS